MLIQELALRSANANQIGRNEFLKFFNLPGVLGEQFFNAFDRRSLDSLSSSDFILGVLTLYKSSENFVLEQIFSLFDFKKAGYISPADVLFLLKNLPRTCPRCGQSLEIAWDAKEMVNILFDNERLLRHEHFLVQASQHVEIPELMLQCLLNGAPAILDDCVLTVGSVSDFPCQPLSYHNKQYYFQLRSVSIYYSSTPDMTNPKGLILLNDLHVEPSGEANFILRNGRFFYEFTAESPEVRDWWVANIRVATNFKEFSEYYSFEKVLGKGAYGEVQLYRRNSDGKLVAVKHIRKEPLDSKAELRILRELAILKLVNHRHIAGLIEYFEKPNELHIVIEYVDGPNLFQWLQSKEFNIPEETTQKILRDVAQALLYLHSLGIVHRDLKLENIIIHENGGEVLEVKLIDFGLSCFLGPGQSSQEPVGTLKYASPEVIWRIPYRDPVDAWGLGVVAYITLIGRMPFYGKTDKDIAT